MGITHFNDTLDLFIYDFVFKSTTLENLEPEQWPRLSQLHVANVVFSQKFNIRHQNMPAMDVHLCIISSIHPNFSTIFDDLQIQQKSSLQQASHSH